jgi:hypothetical protein
MGGTCGRADFELAAALNGDIAMIRLLVGTVDRHLGCWVA